ncbi:hypothetical protein CENSYa_1733 [Cenarchaeum symbiosum A]|uniref:Uncharacterized protein n=1 Tax=Cenarchaeum symbiosum (strain A) TaxID=414004 RepID=A0RYC7_CENSY|nr:hypothetical protein CENSYa_1733 [Cenarchaeum symbiosum A]
MDGQGSDRGPGYGSDYTSGTTRGGDVPQHTPRDSHRDTGPVDVERLALTKQDILEFCDRIIEKWHTDPTKDARYTFAMSAVKASVVWTEEETLKEIWGEISSWVFELLYSNAIAQGNEEDLDWSKIMRKLGKRS